MVTLRTLFLSAAVGVALAPVPALAQSEETPDLPAIPPPPPPGVASETPEPGRSEGEPEPRPEPPVETPAPEDRAEPTADPAEGPEAGFPELPTAAAPGSPGASAPSVTAPAPDPEAGRAAGPEGPRPPSEEFPSPSGETGILRIASADASAPGFLRVGLGAEFFSGGSLFTASDQTTRTVGVLSLSGSPIDYLELWANIRAISNSSDLSRPTLVQSLGDVQLGAKGFYPVLDALSVGLDAQLTVLSGGPGDLGFDLDASSLRFRALFTSDLRKLARPIPLRAHLNAGYVVDNSEALVEGAGSRLDAATRFAYGVGGFDRVTVGAGLEVPVPFVTPFLEYAIEFPVDYLATPGVVIQGSDTPIDPQLASSTAFQDLASDNALFRPAVQRVLPQRLTPGVRVRPTDGLAITVAVEIGLTPEQVAGVPAVPDYNVIGLFSYAIDHFGLRTPASPPASDAPLYLPTAATEPARPKVTGVVLDKRTNQPVPDAIVSFSGALPVATAPDGRFESAALDEGLVTMTVRRAGYEPGRAELSIMEGDEPRVEVVLEPEVVIGTVEGAVVDDAGAPVPEPRVRAIPAEGESRVLASGPDGRFSAPLDAGRWRIVVEADGFLRSGRLVEVEAGETAPRIALQLTPRGETGARVDGDRVVLPERPLYAKGEVAPNAAVRRGLDQVADLLLADPSLRLEVGGHTDSRGNPLDKQAVSAQRAEAARAYLLERGVAPEQVTAEGYAGTRPIAPNLTRTGREQNRRVDFAIR
mgnify:CR=1 FL=1